MLVAISRAEKHLCFWMYLPKLIGQIAASHQRQDDICQQEMNSFARALLGQPQGVDPISRMHNGIAVRSQDMGDHSSYGRLIFH